MLHASLQGSSVALQQTKKTTKKTNKGDIATIRLLVVQPGLHSVQVL